MAFVPSESIKFMREVSGNAWKLWTYLCECRNIVSGQCNPSQQTIAREAGIEFSRVSVAKAELKDEGMLDWYKKGTQTHYVLLVGVKEFERARVKKIAEIERKERRQFAKCKVAEHDFAKCKVEGCRLCILQTPTLQNAKSHIKDEQVVEQVKDVVVANPQNDLPIATTTTTTSSPHAWKQESADKDFCDGLIQRGLFSQEVVSQAWSELLFTVGQRGPGAVATKAELMGFCRAKQRTGALPGIGADVVQFNKSRPQSASISQSEIYCEFDRSQYEQCPLCYGTGQQIVAGKGARRCPNRAERAAAGGVNQ
jgi:hypothetical protein